MKQILIALVLGALLSGVSLGDAAQNSETVAPSASSHNPSSPMPQLHRAAPDLYDFVLHQLNPHNIDWGARYESRRRALLNATACNPDFWFSLVSTLAFIVTFAALIKSMYDHKRKLQIMGRQMDEVRWHDAYSRQVAEEAIRRYNVHTELCNRVAEAESGGLTVATGEGSQIAQLQADLAKARDEIEILKREKSRLGAEIVRPVATTPDPGRGGESPIKKGNGNSQSQTLPATEVVSYADLVRQINLLQQQLYAERERNKHLKGGA